jgi:hypothetical protein
VAQIIQNVDLAPAIAGFETCAANAFDVAFYTGNYFAAYSSDSGNTFNSTSPYQMMKLTGNTFCCDQRVEYIPRIDTFVWILLSNEGPIMLALASPEEIKSSGAKNWTYYDVNPSIFRLPGEDWFDFPQVSFGDNYLYLTFNSVGSNKAVITRFPLNEVGDRSVLHGEHIKTDQWYICPCHNTRGVGWFGAMKSDSEIRVFRWDEAPTSPVFHFDVPISTVPTADYSSLTPDGDDWLPPTSKIDWAITGGARAGDSLWFAWSAGKKYANEDLSPFPHAHIEYVIITIQDFGIGQAITAIQHYIWNSKFAFAWPSLAANSDPDPKVAISFCFGGGDLFPQHAVGVINESPKHATTSGRSFGAGGHYNDIRTCYPNTNVFVAAGFHTAKSDSSPPVGTNHPRYVILKP